MNRMNCLRVLSFIIIAAYSSIPALFAKSKVTFVFSLQRHVGGQELYINDEKKDTFWGEGQPRQMTFELEPGNYTFKVHHESNNYDDFTKKVLLKEGDAMTIKVKLEMRPYRIRIIDETKGANPDVYVISRSMIHAVPDTVSDPDALFRRIVEKQLKAIKGEKGYINIKSIDGSTTTRHAVHKVKFSDNSWTISMQDELAETESSWSVVAIAKDRTYHSTAFTHFKGIEILYLEPFARDEPRKLIRGKEATIRIQEDSERDPKSPDMHIIFESNKHLKERTKHLNMCFLFINRAKTPPMLYFSESLAIEPFGELYMSYRRKGKDYDAKGHFLDWAYKTLPGLTKKTKVKVLDKTIDIEPIPIKETGQYKMVLEKFPQNGSIIVLHPEKKGRESVHYMFCNKFINFLRKKKVIIEMIDDPETNYKFVVNAE